MLSFRKFIWSAKWAWKRARIGLLLRRGSRRRWGRARKEVEKNEFKKRREKALPLRVKSMICEIFGLTNFENNPVKIQLKNRRRLGLISGETSRVRWSLFLYLLQVSFWEYERRCFKIHYRLNFSSKFITGWTFVESGSEIMIEVVPVSGCRKERALKNKRHNWD